VGSKQNGVNSWEMSIIF